MTNGLYLQSYGPEETEWLGETVAGLAPLGTVVALRGDLASGKTCFIRGMARRFAEGDAVHSPTFTLVNEYGGSPKLYHLDLYRLSTEEVADLGYEELFEPEDAVTVVEWAERAEPLLPERRLDIRFAHQTDDRRSLQFEDRGGVMPERWSRVLYDLLVRRIAGEPLDALLESVGDRFTFMRFIRALTVDNMLKTDESPIRSAEAPASAEWINTTIDGFLEAALAWAESAPPGGPLTLPEQPSWKAFAEFLYRGKSYE